MFHKFSPADGSFAVLTSDKNSGTIASQVLLQEVEAHCTTATHRAKHRAVRAFFQLMSSHVAAQKRLAVQGEAAKNWQEIAHLLVSSSVAPTQLGPTTVQAANARQVCHNAPHRDIRQDIRWIQESFADGASVDVMLL